MKQLLFATLIIALAGCGGFKKKQPAEHLKKAMTNYEVALRWSLYKKAVFYHKRRESGKPAAAVNIDAIKELRITGVDTPDIVINDDQTEAIVTVEISYYQQDYGIIKNMRFQQIWWYDPESEHWFTESDFPNLESQ